MPNMTEQTAHQISESAALGAAKISPPVIATSLTLGGVELQDWLIMLTIVYTLIQIFISLPKICDVIKGWRNK